MILSPLLKQIPVQPHKICIVTGGKKQEYHDLARPYKRSNPQTFETHAGNGYGEHESSTE
jgi:hypothetical protein